MFEHLDDPSPLAPSARTLRAVLSRATRLRRRRAVSAACVTGAVVVLGLAVGLTVPGSRPAGPVFAAFDAHVGTLAVGTPVPPANLADVVFISDTHGFGLAMHGASTVLAASTDAGESWRVVDNAVPADLPAQLEFADDRHGYLWGGTPSSGGIVPLWVTSDGGRRWVQAPVGPVVSDVSAIGPDVWAVVGTCPVSSLALAAACPATIDVSLDHGTSWQPTASVPPVSEEPGLSVTDQDLELARITTSRAYVLSLTPATRRRWDPARKAGLHGRRRTDLADPSRSVSPAISAPARRSPHRGRTTSGWCAPRSPAVDPRPKPSTAPAMVAEAGHSRRRPTHRC